MASSIAILGKTVKGVFQKRLNRFLARVTVGERTLQSFVPNPGRMLELLTLGTEVILREVVKGNRKTSYDMIGVLNNGQRVSVDSRLPNKLVREALSNKDIEELSEYHRITGV